MKKIILISVSLLCFCSAHSQLGFSAGLRTGFVNSPDFRTFANSYNQVMVDDISKKLGGFSPSFGWTINADFRISSLFTGMRLNRIGGGKAIVEYKNTSKRHFLFHQNLFVAETGVGFGEGGSLVAITAGLVVGTDYIESYFEYPDGTISYGKDKLLNGVYQDSHFGYLVCLHLGIPIGETISAYCNAEYLFGGAGGSSKSTLDDAHNDKKMDGAFSWAEGLPLDYEEYLLNDPNFEYDVEKYVRGTINGLRLEVGIRIQIGGGS
ncbi:MAG: hypothetical protein KKA07_09080 [Bacteroidetes bacterium]|nr:hypothetical protein [Bacteroidota bacterium]MBU1719213.1 hypothetical protein [Bacteroidota bacterium]